MKVDWIQRVTKWRSVFAGWQLGTRRKGDPESDAVRDHRELSIIERVDINALSYLLIKKGIITREELTDAIQQEAQYLDEAYSRKFPGFKSEDYGMSMGPEAFETTKSWKP